MTIKLVQKHLVKGTQEFQLSDEAVRVRIKPLFKQEASLTVMLAVLNPEPVIRKSRLEFTSRVNNEPLLSLYLAKPNAKIFNEFVNLLRQKVEDEYNAFAGLKPAPASGLEANVYEQPPEFEPSEGAPRIRSSKPVSAEGVETSIRLLAQYIGTEEINPLLSALEALRAEPENEAHRSRVANAFDDLGSSQGAVLTYAPYIGILMSDDPLEK